MGARGSVLSAEDLLARAWDEEADPFSNVVKVTISRLRRKLGEPSVIATVPGGGYGSDRSGGSRLRQRPRALGACSPKRACA